MKKFLAVYTGSESSPKMKEWETLDEATQNKVQREGILAWKDWVKRNEKCIIDMGSPLGPTRKVDTNGISTIKNLLTGYTIIQAESHEAAAKLFLNHPHFKILAGDSVEIVECIEIPGI